MDLEGLEIWNLALKFLLGPHLHHEMFKEIYF